MRSLPLLFSLLIATAAPGLIRSEEKTVEPKPEIAASPPAIEIHRQEPIDLSRDRTVPVKVYLPATKLPEAVVIFSHGLGGSRENSAYLGEHWAAHGYVAVFVQHAGSDEAVWKGAEPSHRLETLKKAITLKAAVDRYLDIPFVLDQLEKWNAESGHSLEGRLDLEHIGL